MVNGKKGMMRKNKAQHLAGLEHMTCQLTSKTFHYSLTPVYC